MNRITKMKEKMYPKLLPEISLKNKTIIVSGGSRGIGLAIVKECAKEGANIVILAKTTTPHPKLPGTIYTAAKEIESVGGKALPLKCDIRHEKEVLECVKKAVDTFGGIDIVINNASAINLSDTQTLKMKRFDLMHSVNVRGTYLLTKCCLPYLKKSSHPHILNLSPPLNMEAKWFAN